MMAINLMETNNNDTSSTAHKEPIPSKMDEITSRVNSLMLQEEKGPTVYQIESAPQCEGCVSAGVKFFDFACTKCEAIVATDQTSIGQLLAIARQWSPSVQNKMNVLIMEILRRGAHADDRDALTDM